MKCPVCYKVYEPSMAQGEGDKVAREQHISGICSQECWDNLFPADVCDEEEDWDEQYANGYDDDLIDGGC